MCLPFANVKVNLLFKTLKVEKKKINKVGVARANTLVLVGVGTSMWFV